MELKLILKGGQRTTIWNFAALEEKLTGWVEGEDEDEIQKGFLSQTYLKEHQDRKLTDDYIYTILTKNMLLQD